MKCLFLTPVAVSLLLTAASAQSTSDFFKRNLVVDGTGGVLYRSGSALERYPEGPDRTHDFGALIQATGVNVSVMSFSSDPGLMTSWQSKIDRGEFTGLRIIRKFADLEMAYRKGEYGLVFYVQTVWPLGGSLEPIRRWYEDGLRVFQIAYGSSDPVAPEDKLGTGTSNEDPETEGLTAFGKEVVQELNRLGMIIDVSHCNLQTTLDTVALSTAPVVSSHAGCAALVPVKRNKSDEEIRAIAKSGGVFGITPIGWMLAEDRANPSINDFIRHLEHAIQIGGIDHVAIASDGPRNGWGEDSQHYPGAQLDTEKRWINLYEELKERGYSEEDLAKVFGRNWLRVFRKVFK